MKTDLKEIPKRVHKGKFTARVKKPTRVPPGGPTNRAERRALAARQRKQ